MFSVTISLQLYHHPHYCLFQKNRRFYVTALIIPKQESTSDSVSKIPLYYFKKKKKESLYCSLDVFPGQYPDRIFCMQCQTTNEEEIFEVQDKQALFPLGWIHVSFFAWILVLDKQLLNYDVMLSINYCTKSQFNFYNLVECYAFVRKYVEEL